MNEQHASQPQESSQSPQTGRSERLNPHPIYLGLIGFVAVAVGVGGLVAVVAGSLGGLLWVGLAAALTLFFGVVDLDPDGVTVRKIYGAQTISYHEIADVGLTYRRARSMKWWMPMLTLHDGKKVKLGVLSAPTKKGAKARCERIVAMAGETNRVIEQERAAALQSDQPLFVPLEGLEHHYQPSR